MNKILKHYIKMNKILKHYINMPIDCQGRPNVWELHKDILCFSNKEEFFNYLDSLDHPHKMGTFICMIGFTKYLLEIEPWTVCCLRTPAFEQTDVIESSSDAEVIQLINKHYVKPHIERLGVIPDETQFLPNLKLTQELRDCGCLGISYALVKLDE